MNILVRLPNWLGDVVMSFAFIDALHAVYPHAAIDVIVNETVSDLPRFCHHVSAIHAYPRAAHAGLRGGCRFGRLIRARKPYDVFFCLPRSCSSTMMGLFTGSPVRIGYRTEFRRVLLTHSYPRPAGLHRVDEFLYLLRQFSGTDVPDVPVSLTRPAKAGRPLPEGKNLLLNINSEAQSRTVPLEFARSVIEAIRREHDFNVILTGSAKDVPAVTALAQGLRPTGRIHNYAGTTDLPGLVSLVGHVDYVISTDSGLAHLANAMSKKTIVLFGAGDERRTRPYNEKNLTVIRKRGLDCAPCVSNVCRYGRPICLSELDVAVVLEALNAFVALEE